MRILKKICLLITYILMFLVFAVTVYFCLDVFGIVEIPQKYSIASIFYSEIELIADQGKSFDEIFDVESMTNPDNTVKKERFIRKEEIIANTIDFNEAIAKLNEATQEINQEKDTLVELDETNIDPRRFYYNQLDQYGRIIYNELYKNKENLKTGTYTVEFGRAFNELLNTEGGTDILNNDFQLAINAFTFDNPDLFYIDVTKVYLLTEITTRAFFRTYDVSIGSNGGSYISDRFSNPEELNEAINKVESVKNMLVNRQYADNYERIKVVHDYLVDNIDYSSDDNVTAYNIYGALVEGKCVCEGYARAYKYILDDMDIPCIIVCGIGRNKENETESHAWNDVYLRDNWYAVDVTWDDPVIIGTGILVGNTKYHYFLNGANKLFEDHYEDGNIVGDASFAYPKISVINYQ